MNHYLRPVLLLLLLSMGLTARGADVTALRSWRAPDNTRIVLELSAPVQFRISPESTPAQLVLEIDGSQSTVTAPHVPASSGPVRRVRFDSKGSQLRLLVDLGAEVSPKAFQLAPNEKYGQRLVLDLFDKTAVPTALPAVPAPVASTVPVAVPAPLPVVTPVVPASVPVKPITTQPVATLMVPPAVQIVERPLLERPASEKAPAEKPLATVASGTAAKPLASGPTEPKLLTSAPPPEKAAGKPQQDKAPAEKATADKAAEKAVVDKSLRRGRNIIIAIDAGHGGEDPGAIGLHGSYEKNVTLAIARELAALFKAAPGITPVLTRDGDYFIPLQDRRQIARYKDHADIFISIHADSAPARAAKGASVFALSLKGANTATSRFARMLAERENRADLIGGVAIQKDDEDSVLRNVLADMVVTGSLEHSLRMGRNILEGLDHVGELHSEQVEQAGFAVLKEPGMVSLLVETGFISNPDEEKRLTSKPHQREIAKAVFDGALRYCQQYPAPGSYFAWLYDKNRAEKDAQLARADSKAGSKADARTDAKLDAKAEAGTNAGDDRLASNDSKPVQDSKSRLITHRIMNGDSLKALALRYQTTPKSIRELNGLDDDTVRVGQILKVPAN